MARKDNLDFVDKAVESANLQEKTKKENNKNKTKKVKTIQILVDWEEKIKAYHGGTVAGYITTAIQNQMKNDGIL